MIGAYLSVIYDENEKVIFENLYYDMKDKMYTAAFSLLNDEHCAEDAVSEAFLHIAKRFGKLSHLHYNQFRVYCIITVKNISKNFIRTDSSSVTVDIDGLNNEQFTVNNEMKHIDEILLKEKISELGDDEQELLMLYYFYQYSLREISKLKNIKYDTVQKRIQKCRKKLKELLEENDHA